MARLFVTDINLNKNELQNARIQGLTNAPSAPVTGQIYFNTSDKVMYYYNGLSEPNGPWMPMSGSTEVITDVVLAAVKGGTALTEVTDDANNTVTLNLDNTAVTPGSYGSQTQIPTFTVDAQGRLTAAGTVDVATELDITGDTGSTSISLLTEGLTVAGGEGIDVAVTENTITISAEDASDTNKGIASFNSTAFSVTSGHVNLVGFDSNINANNKIIQNLGAPVDPNDAATKAYVDAVAEGLHVHEAAKVYVAANVDIATDLQPGDLIDGVTLSAGMRVLVNGQTTKSQNGIYVVQATGPATRALDFDSPNEVKSGDFIFVSSGSSYGNTGWVQTNATATIGVSEISFTQFSGAGTFTAGSGLTLNGTEFSVDVTPGSGSPSLINTGGAVEVKTDTTRGLSVDTNGLGLNVDTGLTFSHPSGKLAFATGYGVRKYTTTVGGSTTATVTHSFGTREVQVQVFDSATYDTVEADVVRTTTDSVTIGFAVAPSAGAYTVVVIG